MSDWHYYEDKEGFDRMRVDLLETYLSSNSRGQGWYPYMLKRLWLERFKGKDTIRKTKLVSLEKLVNGEWVPVKVEFTEPSVTILVD